MDYNFVEELEELIEEIAEIIFLAEEAIEHLWCRRCNRKTVHKAYRENPDGGIDEVGLKCRKCGKFQ